MKFGGLMIKKIGVWCFVLLASVLAVFGCTKDKYKDMSLSVTDKDGQAVESVELSISRNASNELVYDECTVYASVSAGKDVSKDVRVSGVDDKVSYTIENRDGKSEIKLKALNPGNAAIKVSTLEGGFSKTFSVKVLNTLTKLSFIDNTNGQIAFEKGTVVDFGGKYSQYLRFDTAVSGNPDIYDIEYSVGISGVDNGTYTNDNGVFFDNNGKLHLGDVSGCNFIKVTAKVRKSATEYYMVGDSVMQASCVFPVVKIERNIGLQMNSDSLDENDGSNWFNVQAVSKNFYEIDLADPGFGTPQEITNNYLIQRRFFFNMGNSNTYANNENYNYSVYSTIYSTAEGENEVLESVGYDDGRGIVSVKRFGLQITLKSEDPGKSETKSFDAFTVSANTSSDTNYIIKRFKISHKNYSGFDQFVDVKFVIRPVPNNILINGESVEANRDIVRVFNAYDGSSADGTCITVDSLEKYVGLKFYVGIMPKVIDTEHETANTALLDAVNNDIVLTNRYGKQWNMAKYDMDTGTWTYDKADAINMNIDGVTSVYIKHKFPNNNIPKDEYCIVFIFNYDVKPSHVDKSDGFKTYPIQSKITAKNLLGINSFDRTQVRDREYNAIYNNGHSDVLYEFDENNIASDLIKVVSMDESIVTTSFGTLYVDKDGNDVDNRHKVFFQINSDYKTGSTKLVLKAYNGVTTTINVSVYAPMYYTTGLPRTDGIVPNGDVRFTDPSKVIDSDTYNNYAPFAIETNKKNTAIFKIEDKLDLKDADGKPLNVDNGNYYIKYYTKQQDGSLIDSQDIGYTYGTIYSLYVASNSQIPLNFYNFMPILGETTDGDGNSVTSIVDVRKININDRCSVKVSNAFSWTNGVLTIGNLLTTNNNTPFELEITYSDYVQYCHQQEGENYEYYFYRENLTVKIKIYIYDSLRNIRINNGKNVTLYQEQSLGTSEDAKKLASHEIKYDLNPSLQALGGSDNVEVSVVYDANTVLAQVRVFGQDNPVAIKIQNLFKVDGKVIRTQWNHDSDSNLSSVDLHNLYTSVGDKLVFNITIKVTQFNKLEAFDTMTVKLDYAQKVNQISVDIDDEGLYFEAGSNNVRKVTYTVSPANALNKKLRIPNYANLYYATYLDEECKKSTNGVLDPGSNNTGVFYIKAQSTPVTTSIVMVSDDSFGKENATQIEYEVNVANGSALYPYQIRTSSQFSAMLDRVGKEGSSDLYYVLTRDINLYDRPYNKPFNYTGQFELNGKHTYYKNNVLYTTYAAVYGVQIMGEVSKNVGLFQSIPYNARFENMSFKNAIINAQVNSADTNIGVLAGTFAGEFINSSIEADIVVDICGYKANIGAVDTCKYNVNIGAIAGKMISTKIGKVERTAKVKGAPVSTIDGFIDSRYNVRANITIYKTNTSDTDTHDVYVGGAFGQIALNSVSTGGEYDVEDIYVLVNITNNIIDTDASQKGIKHLIAGGFAGSITGVSLSNVTISPKIRSAHTVGGLFGEMTGIGGTTSTTSTIENAIVYFANEQVTALDATSIIGTKYIAGLVAKINDNALLNVENTYTRSFTARDIDNKQYYGNLYALVSGENVNNDTNTYIGGIFAYVGSSATIDIKKTYHSGDISDNTDSTTSENIVVNPFIAYSASDIKIENSYSHGKVKTTKPINLLLPVGDIVGGVVSYGTEDGYQTASGNATNVSKYYGAINDEMLTIVNKDGGYYSTIKIASGNREKFKIADYAANQSKTINELFTDYGFAIINGTKDENATFPGGNDWFANSEYADLNDKYPVIIVQEGVGQSYAVLYDVLPDQVKAEIIEYQKGKETKQWVNSGHIDATNGGEISKVVLMYNATSQGSTADNVYLLQFDGNTADIGTTNGYNHNIINITLQGKTKSVDWVNLYMNNNLTILVNDDETSDASIIDVYAYYLKVKNTGRVKITIRSDLNHNVFTEVEIVIVPGISNFDMNYDKEQLKTSNPDDVVNADSKASTVYINQDKTYYFNATNGDYITNSNIGYLIQFEDCNEPNTEPADRKPNASIMFNNVEYGADTSNKSIIIGSDGKLTISGKVSGGFDNKMAVRVTPFINLSSVVGNDVFYLDTTIKLPDNCILIDALLHNYTLFVKNKAQSVTITNASEQASFSPSGEITLNIEVVTGDIGDTLMLAMFKGFVNNVANNSLNGTSLTQGCKLINSLLKAYVDEVELPQKVTKLDKDGNVVKDSDGNEVKEYVTNPQGFYVINYSVTFTFNVDEYRKNAEKYSLNNENYTLYFVSGSEKSVNAKFNITINPSETTSIGSKFYPSAENKNNEYNPAEVESDYIAPGRSGLMKIFVDPEFSNTDYVVVRVPSNYRPYISFAQKVATKNQSGLTTGYQEQSYRNIIADGTYYGIVLSKQSSIIYDGDGKNSANYLYSIYDNTLYAYISVSQSAPQGQSIPIEVVAYQTTSSGDVEVLTTPHKHPLLVQNLPSVNIAINGMSDYVHVMNGSSNAISISADNFETITFRPESADDLTPSMYSIVDENGTYVSDTFDLSANKKYYLIIDKTALTNANINDSENPCDNPYSLLITVTASRNINGISEKTESTIKVKITNYMFDDDKMGIEHTENGVMNLPMGVTQELLVALRDAMKNDEVLKVDNKDMYDANGNLVYMSDIIAHAWSGYTSVGLKDKDGNDTTEILSNRFGVGAGVNLWTRQITNDNGEYEWEQLGTNGTYADFDFRSAEDNHYYISGKRIGSNAVIGIEVKYTFDKDGNPILVNGDESKYSRVYRMFAQCIVNVTENSTYDNPMPIYDVDDLKALSEQTSGHYILLNNLEVSDWTPMEANFDSLDGNGYTIKINSFNFDEYRQNNTSQYLGFFSTVSQNTVLKNLTFDISPMLINEKEMNEQIASVNTAGLNYDKDTYTSLSKADISFIDNATFGVIAGQNQGSITNSKVVNRDDGDKNIFHVLSYLGYNGSTLYSTTVAGLVGENASGGAITNSFIGFAGDAVVKAKVGETISLINSDFKTTIKLEDKTLGIDTGRELSDTSIHPFALAGGRMLAGIAGSNSGVISASSVRGLSLINTMTFASDGNNIVNKTGGITVENSKTGRILSSFVQNRSISNYRPKVNDKTLFTVSDMDLITSVGYVGVFAYENAGSIKNSYTAMIVNNNATNSAGFVYTNFGTIETSYSASIHRKMIAGGNLSGGTTAFGMFVGEKNTSSLDTGTITNCYYLIDVSNQETLAPLQTAKSIEINKEINKDEVCPAGQSLSYVGFNFGSTPGSGSIWRWEKGSLPKLVDANIIATSFRQLDSIEVDKDKKNADGEAPTVYKYVFIGNQLGIQNNPILIDSGSHFVTYILDMQKLEKGNYRLINDLDFADVDFSKLDSDIADRERLYEITFTGSIYGNGMILSNLKWNTSDAQANFGLFAEINDGSIKNISMHVANFSAKNSNNVGVLAGTISDAKLVDIEITSDLSVDKIGTDILDTDNSSSVYITGKNFVGGVAGVVQNSTLFDIRVHDIAIVSSYSSIEGFTNSSYDESGKFITFNEKSFKQYASISDKDVSYAGGIAGIMLGGNAKTAPSNKVAGSEKDEFNGTGNVSEKLLFAYTEYRTNTDKTNYYGLTVSGNIAIIGEHVGGVTGYLGSDARLKQASFILGDEGTQTLYGKHYTGGIVGENHGIIEQVYVEHTEAKQKEINLNITDDYVVSASTLFGGSPLFRNAEDQVNVAIGGIAGYSSGAIVDSYSLVNVKNNYSQIAGGIVGYAKNYNYMAYVYTTGDVLGKHVTGGAVGFYTYADNYELYLRSVTALNTWSLDAVNKLKANQMNLYPGAENIAVRMPEIGNQRLAVNKVTVTDGGVEKTYYFQAFDLNSRALDPNSPDNLTYWLQQVEVEYEKDKDGNIIYENGEPKIVSYPSEALYNPSSNTTFYFVGSVVGKVTASGGDNYTMYDGTALDSDFATLNGENGEATEYYNKTAHGVYSTTHSSCTPAYSDFDYKYVLWNDGTEISNDAIINASNKEQNTVSNNIADVLGQVRFDRVLGYQETVAQLIGKYQGPTTQASYKNVFINYYNNNNRTSSYPDKDASGKYTNGYNGMFYDKLNAENANNATNKIWAVRSGEYLPSKNFGTFSNVIYIKNNTDLKNAFSNPSDNITYIVCKNDDEGSNGEYTINCKSGNISQFSTTFRGVLIGQNIGSETETKYPTINININTSNGQTSSSLLNEILGATISKLNFNISVGGNLSYTNSEIQNVGLFANSMRDTTMSEVTFAIKHNGSIIQFGSANTNFGFAFGQITNSTLNAVTVNVTEINNAMFGGKTNDNNYLTSFGLLAGDINNGTLTGVTVSGNTMLLGGAVPQNIGGIAGKISATNINNSQSTFLTSYNTNLSEIISYNNLTDLGITKLDDLIIDEVNDDETTKKSKLDKIKIVRSAMSITNPAGKINIGAVAGYSETSSIVRNSTTSYSINTLVTKKNAASIGGVIGYATSTSIQKVSATASDSAPIFIGSTEGNAVDKSIQSTHKQYGIYVRGDADTMYAGGLIGYATNGANISNSNNNSRIFVATGSVNGQKAYAGGLVGMIANTSNTTIISSSYAIGDIMFGAETVIYKSDEDKITTTIFAGGLVGSTTNISIENVYYYGNIVANGNYHNSNTITLTNADASKKVNVYDECTNVVNQNIGGLVGAGSCTIKYYISNADILYYYSPSVTIKIGGVLGGGNDVIAQYGYNYARIKVYGDKVTRLTNQNAYSFASSINESSEGNYTVREFITTDKDYALLTNREALRYGGNRPIINIQNYANLIQPTVDTTIFGSTMIFLKRNDTGNSEAYYYNVYPKTLQNLFGDIPANEKNQTADKNVIDYKNVSGGEDVSAIEYKFSPTIIDGDNETIDIDLNGYTVLKTALDLKDLGATTSVEGIISGFVTDSGYNTFRALTVDGKTGKMINSIGVNGAICGVNVDFVTTKSESEPADGGAGANANGAGNTTINANTFIDTNNGLLADVFYTAVINSADISAPVATTNNGLIVRSGSMVAYSYINPYSDGAKDATATELGTEASSFFVGTNNGAMYDDFTLSFTYYLPYAGTGLVAHNNGYVYNSYHATTDEARFITSRDENDGNQYTYTLIGATNREENVTPNSFLSSSMSNVIDAVKNTDNQDRLRNMEYTFMELRPNVWQENKDLLQNFGYPYITALKNSGIIKNVSGTAYDDSYNGSAGDYDKYYGDADGKYDVAFFQKNNGDDVVISNEAQFIKFFERGTGAGKVLITEDITITKSFDYQIENFSGQILGQKKPNKDGKTSPITISGLRLNAPLFGTFSGRMIDVQFENCSSTSVSIITATNTGTIRGANMTDCRVNYQGNSSESIGLIASSNTGNIAKCQINDCSISTSQFGYVGLIAGQNTGSGFIGGYKSNNNILMAIQDSSISVNVTEKLDQAQAVGGVVGYNEAELSKGGSTGIGQYITIKNLTISASSVDNVGGVVGLSTKSVIAYQIQESSILGRYFVGGVAGRVRISDNDKYELIAKKTTIVDKIETTDYSVPDSFSYEGDVDAIYNINGVKGTTGGVIDTTVSGKNFVGGIVGVGTISATKAVNVYGGKVTSTLSSDTTYAGGAVGVGLAVSKEAGLINITNATISASSSGTVGGAIGIGIAVTNTSDFLMAKNISVNNITLQNANVAGGIVGTTTYGNSKITNCYVGSCESISAKTSAGGIIGQIDNVYNTSKKYFNTSIESCQVYASKIVSSNGSAGGLVGYVRSNYLSLNGNKVYDDSSTLIAVQKSLASYFNMQIQGWYAGGLVGTAYNSQIGAVDDPDSQLKYVDNSVLYTELKGSTASAGVVANISNSSKVLNIEMEKNNYILMFTSNNSALLVGISNISTIQNCVSAGTYYYGSKYANSNRSTDTSNATLSNIAGICAELTNVSKIYSCVNKANIIGDKYVAGICSTMDASCTISSANDVDNTYLYKFGTQEIKGLTVNAGAIKAKNGYVGGIIGESISATNSSGGNLKRTATLSNCMNEGDIYSANGNCVGGIAGQVKDIQISNVVNKASVEGEKGGYVGGIFGSTSGSDMTTKLEGEIIVDAKNSKITASKYYVGGVAGFAIINITTSDIPNISVEIGEIKGDRFVGAVFGKLECLNDKTSINQKAIVTFDELKANAYAGGFAGSAVNKNNQALTFSTSGGFSKESSGTIINIGVTLSADKTNITTNAPKDKSTYSQDYETGLDKIGVSSAPDSTFGDFVNMSSVLGQLEYGNNKSLEYLAIYGLMETPNLADSRFSSTKTTTGATQSTNPTAFGKANGINRSYMSTELSKIILDPTTQSQTTTQVDKERTYKYQYVEDYFVILPKNGVKASSNNIELTFEFYKQTYKLSGTETTGDVSDDKYVRESVEKLASITYTAIDQDSTYTTNINDIPLMTGNMYNRIKQEYNPSNPTDYVDNINYNKLKMALNVGSINTIADRAFNYSFADSIHLGNDATLNKNYNYLKAPNDGVKSYNVNFTGSGVSKYYINTKHKTITNPALSTTSKINSACDTGIYSGDAADWSEWHLTHGVGSNRYGFAERIVKSQVCDNLGFLNYYNESATDGWAGLASNKDATVLKNTYLVCGVIELVK